MMARAEAVSSQRHNVSDIFGTLRHWVDFEDGLDHLPGPPDVKRMSYSWFELVWIGHTS
jgi:hypothetical protein